MSWYVQDSDRILSLTYLQVSGVRPATISMQAEVFSLSSGLLLSYRLGLPGLDGRCNPMQLR